METSITKPSIDQAETVRHHGQCHCGAVQFEFEAPAAPVVTLCNCSICTMSGYEHIIIPQHSVSITGGENLTSYRFGTGTAEHLFCQICGVKPLYRPRSHPDSYSVNRRCVTPGTMADSAIIEFDGQNWESSIDSLRGKI